MKSILFIALSLILLVACKKDKIPEPEPPCTGVTLSGDRSAFVGTWRWYKTVVREWFDIGPDLSHEYTPITEGFEYYITISEDGKFKSYRDGILEDDFILSAVDYEIFVASGGGMVFKIDCTPNEVGFIYSTLNPQVDSIASPEYPLNFYNEIEKRESKDNYFVRE
jgi:hypothetical protein